MWSGGECQFLCFFPLLFAWREIAPLKSRTSFLPSSHLTGFQSRCSGTNQLYFSSDGKKKRGRGKLPLRATGEDEEEIQKVSASVAAANEVSADNAAAAVFVRSGWHFHPKRRTENGTEGFYERKRCSRFTPEWLWQKFCETHRSSPRGRDLHLMSPLTLTGSLELLLLPGSTGSKEIWLVGKHNVCSITVTSFFLFCFLNGYFLFKCFRRALYQNDGWKRYLNLLT